MFTGIITDVGRVRAVRRLADTRIEVETAIDTSTLPLGASVAMSGVCFTVVDKGAGWFAVDASHETLSCTTLGTWVEGTRVNLERALRVGDELGGHIVTGHVDGVGELRDVREDAGSRRMTIALPDALAPYVARKGSIAVDGVSLTVNAVGDPPDACFEVNVIPHTLAHTTLAGLRPGDRVNLEIDILARYLDRLQARMTERS
ncbi:MAG: riboflavin synthase [Alphaproteobacteria bacterium]|nr:MAG: riboflavin synthase [Alphaproteobacteria bacterium]